MFPLTGCGVVASHEPIYDSKRDAIFDPQLLGTWRAQFPQGEVTLRFTRGSGNRYAMEVGPEHPPAAEPSTQMPVAELVPIGKYRYLFFDVSGTPYGTILFPCYQVQLRGESLRLAMLNPIHFQTTLEQNPGLLKYEKVPIRGLPEITEVSTQSSTRPTTGPSSMNIMLTDDPARIRRALIEHQDDPNWFDESVVLHRPADVLGKSR